MRFHELLKLAPYTQSHASEVTAATGGTYAHGNAHHEHDASIANAVTHSQQPCKSDIMHPNTATQLATHTHTPTARGVSESRARPKACAADDARAPRASICIDKLNGARLALGRRLAGDRFRFEAYRSSSRPPSSFWQRMLESTKSSERMNRPAATSAVVTIVDSESCAAFSTTSCRPHRGPTCFSSRNVLYQKILNRTRRWHRSFSRHMETSGLHVPREGFGVRAPPGPGRATYRFSFEIRRRHAIGTL